MQKLNPKIVKKLATDLSLSERTVKNNIFALAPKYPNATPNARAHIYAQDNDKNVYRLLDADDKKSIPQPSISVIPKNTPQKSIRIQIGNNPDSLLNKLWVQVLIAILSFVFTGVIAGTIAQVLGIYIAVQLGITS